MVADDLYILPDALDDLVSNLQSPDDTTSDGETRPSAATSLPQQQQQFTTPKDFWLYKEQLPRHEEEDNDQPTVNHIDEFTSHVDRLAKYIQICENVSSQVSSALDLLDNLEAQHHLVSHKTQSLHETCTALLEEQSKLDNSVRDIQTPMDYFQELDRLGPMIGLPLTSELVSADVLAKNIQQGRVRQVSARDNESFAPILQRLDECIAFVDEHPYFRDAEQYARKFRQLRFRALSMVRNVVVESVQASVDSVFNGLQVHSHSANNANSKVVANNTYTSLMYVRFRALAKQLRPSIEELEKRVAILQTSGHEEDEEGKDLLNGCYQFFCNQRSRLLQSVMMDIIPQENPGPDVDFVQKICHLSPMVLQVCVKEFELFSQFFLRIDQLDQLAGTNTAPPSEPLTSRNAKAMPHAYSEAMIGLCRGLYDYLRPLVVREQDMNKLCVAVQALQDEVLEGMVYPRGVAAYPLQYVLQLLLDDVKEKLAFCSFQYIHNEILGHHPTPADIDYPERLVAQDDGHAVAGKTKHYGWNDYVTVGRTLGLLSNLYRHVEASIFEDLMEESVTGCAISLTDAARRITEKTKDPLDGELFLIKQLLFLREQITGFVTSTKHVTEKRLDFTTTTSALQDLISHRGLLFSFNRNNAILEFVQHGVPVVKENRLDCKKNLEDELRTVCRSFRVRTTQAVLGPVLGFMRQSASFSAVANNLLLRSQGMQPEQGASKPQGNLSQQPFATKEKLLENLAKANANIPARLREVLDRMALYLRNPGTGHIPETRSILFAPIPTQIFSTLNDFKSIIEEEYPDDQVPELVDAVDAIRGSVAQVAASSKNKTHKVEKPAFVSDPADAGSSQADLPDV